MEILRTGAAVEVFEEALSSFDAIATGFKVLNGVLSRISMQRRSGSSIVARAISLAMLSIMACTVLPKPSDALAAEATETAIKAAFLYKFGFFVGWPDSAFPAADSPINLCIVGDDPFGAALDDTVKNQKIGDRPIAVKRLPAATRESGCHIVYLPSTVSSRSAQLLAALQGSNTLTVTDVGAGGQQAGIINFVMKDNRVRFDIDDAAAASVGLTISSRLLNLAVAVKPRR